MSKISRIACAFTFTFVLAGCSTNPESSSHEDQLTDDNACLSAWRYCHVSDQCCSGYCDTAGGYAGGKCSPPQAEGAFCSQNSECQSKLCNNYQCTAPGCFADKATCLASSDCCSGWCDTRTDPLGSCAAPQPFGYFCEDHNECLSRACDKHRCQHPRSPVLLPPR